MAIYSKTGKRWSIEYGFKIVKSLNDVDLTADNVTYYHHPYDSLFHNVKFSECLNLENFEHIRNNPTVTLVHENSCEAIDHRFAEDVYILITKHNINPAQIKIVTADSNHKNFLKNYLENKNIFNVNIVIINYLLSNVKELPNEIENEIVTKQKFSSLSRNYKEWRLFLYKELFDNDLLKYFKYSFHNIWPYTDVPTVFSTEKMVTDLKNLGISNISKEFIEWLDACPYDFKEEKGGGVKNKWSNVTYDAILLADFHLMVETHFDQRSFTGQINFDRSFGPSSITEKAYKVIACSRPFITFATPYFLEDLRNLGYKTFSPYINESYDVETDNVKRLNMIVAEVNRICNLPDAEYATLVENCRDIAKFNLEHFKISKRNYKNVT